jgi:pilus assembly protein CpaB
MGRRTILLIAAIAVAALGTALVFMYANRAEDMALKGQAPVEVLVATAGIQSGTSGTAISEAGAVELKKLPAASVPAGALSDLTPVADLMTLGSVFEGQVLLQPMFGSPQAASGGLALPEGKMGVSVQLSDPQRVAGFVKPGSEVAVFVTTAAEGRGADASAAETSLLLERVQVVAVGPSTVSSTTTTSEEGTTNTEEIPFAILTLALDQEQAQKVILATSTAQIHFALLGAASKTDDSASSTTTQTLLG